MTIVELSPPVPKATFLRKHRIYQNKFMAYGLILHRKYQSLSSGTGKEFFN